jgi:hypothetical protein
LQDLVNRKSFFRISVKQSYINLKIDTEINGTS